MWFNWVVASRCIRSFECHARIHCARETEHVRASLSADKYGDRSPAIGKRFGRLKTALGFGPKHVFHSIRSTVATLLENAGVPENVSADIIGHDKDTMTCTSLEAKRKAIGKLRY